jgi:hypothetical protein
MMGFDVVGMCARTAPQCVPPAKGRNNVFQHTAAHWAIRIPLIVEQACLGVGLSHSTHWDHLL